MRRIETTFASHHLEAVVEAVLALPVQCEVSASQVLFADGATSHTEQYRGAIYNVPWRQRTQLEIVADEDDAEQVLQAVLRVFEKDSAVDGLVRMSAIDDAICIRTGKRRTEPRTSWMPLERG
jgi:nitrogen regulatory protein P-II 1